MKKTNLFISVVLMFSIFESRAQWTSGTSNNAYTTKDVGIDIDVPVGKLQIVNDNRSFAQYPQLFFSGICNSQGVEMHGTSFSHYSASTNCQFGSLDFSAESPTYLGMNVNGFPMFSVSTTTNPILRLNSNMVYSLADFNVRNQFLVNTNSTYVNNKFFVNNDIEITGSFKIKNSSSSNVFAIYQDGNVRSREITVDLQPIPDYVFKPEYKLMSLDKLEEYIKANYHLPNIKSETEYKSENSIALGELNMKLLEKVEELTLYVIELKKEIDVLKKSNR